MEAAITETRSADVHSLFRPYLDTDQSTGNTEPGFDEQPPAARAITIEQGIYAGKWKDGQDLFEAIRRISDATISMAPAGGSGHAVPYTFVGNNTYRNYSGSRIVVQSKNVLVWTNADGGNRVTYTRKICHHDQRG